MTVDKVEQLGRYLLALPPLRVGLWPVFKGQPSDLIDMQLVIGYV